MPLTVQLNNGVTMPMVGCGMYRIVGTDKVFNTINTALKVGFRSFDTAAVYKNEYDIGLALKKYLPVYGLTREDIFITTKLSPDDNYPGRVPQAVENSLTRLQMPYVDLYLIHWPGAAGVPVDHKSNRTQRREIWTELVELHHRKKCRALGVSNYTVRHLEELVSDCDGIVPTVNQVEYHPYYQQRELLQKCKESNVHMQAYSSFGGTGNSHLINDPNVKKVAQHVGKSSAQVLLRWAIQHGVGVIPKAERDTHIANNYLLDFRIPDEDMQLLDNIPTVKKYSWNPDPVY